MMRLAHLFVTLLLLLQHHADGRGLLRGLLRRVDYKVRPALRKRLIDRKPGSQKLARRRLTSSGSSGGDSGRYVSLQIDTESSRL